MEIDKFADFDKALLAQVRAGRGTMRQLDTDASGLRELAWPLCRRGLLSRPVPPPRVIGDRLKALEARELIKFNGRVWEVATRSVRP